MSSIQQVGDKVLVGQADQVIVDIAELVAEVLVHDVELASRQPGHDVALRGHDAPERAHVALEREDLPHDFLGVLPVETENRLELAGHLNENRG